jgi:nucleoside 2-deoxyribosyltransferase
MLRSELQKHGIEVISSWIDADDSDLTADSTSAKKDLEDLRNSDICIFFSDQYGTVPGRGKFIELGFATCASIPVILIGPSDTWADSIYYSQVHEQLAAPITTEGLVSVIREIYGDFCGQ